MSVSAAPAARGSASGPFCIAGGGTAGHVLPGLAVARELMERGVARDRIVWIGAERGIERELVPAAGIELVALPGRGIQRRLSRQNLAAARGLAVALVRGVREVRRRRPAVVMVLGGYASLGPGIGAVLTRTPLVVAEQNARAGAANRLLGRFAVAAAVPFAETDLPRATVTGNPVRAEILDRAVDPATSRAEARAELGIAEDRVLVAAFAGSLGSTRINEAVVGLAERWAERAEVHLHHVVGRRDAATLAVPREDPGGLTYRRVDYEDRMDRLLAAADVAVCRSGGTTVAELAVLGVPSILVPLPIAPRDHQRANAGPLVRAGGAVLVGDPELDVQRLVDELTPIVEDPGRRRAMAVAARSIARPDAAAAVCDLLEANAR